MLMRADLLKKYGLLDKDYFIYHDDLEYCLRLKIVGYKAVLVPNSIFWHKYSFDTKPEKYYLMERNRKIVLLTYYKIPTLLLILPLFLVMEFGLILFSILNGWFKQKLKEYYFWLHKSSWEMVFQKRKYIQTKRTVGDKKLLKDVATKVDFADIDNFVLRYIANPLMTVYWGIVSKIICW